MDITQIGYAGAGAKAADTKISAVSLVQSSKKSAFSSFLSASNSGADTGGVDVSAQSLSQQKADNTNQEAYDRYQYKDNAVAAAKETTTSERVEALSDETEGLASGVIRTIAEDLDVDEDAVVQAMEALGLTVFDLSNAQSLAELVKQLTLVSDDAQILLDADFQQAFVDVTGLVEQFAAENGLSGQELADFAAEYAAGSAETSEPVEADVEIPESFTEDVPADIGETAQPDVIVMQEEPVEAGMTALDEQQPNAQQEARVIVDDRRTQPAEEPVEAADTEVDEKGSTEIVLEIHPDEKDSGQKDASNNRGNAQDFAQNVAAAFTEQFAGEVQTQGFEEIPEYVSWDARDIIDQIVEQTRVILEQDATSIEMQLNPENLGKIFLNISTKEGAVSAQLFAQNEEVRAALELQIATLTNNLNQAGVKVDAIEVSVAAHEFERNLEQNAKGEEEQGRREEEKKSQRRTLRIDTLDDLSGLMSEEEALVAQIMRDNGNSVDFSA